MVQNIMIAKDLFCTNHKHTQYKAGLSSHACHAAYIAASNPIEGHVCSRPCLRATLLLLLIVHMCASIADIWGLCGASGSIEPACLYHEQNSLKQHGKYQATEPTSCLLQQHMEALCKTVLSYFDNWQTQITHICAKEVAWAGHALYSASVSLPRPALETELYQQYSLLKKMCPS